MRFFLKEGSFSINAKLVKEKVIVFICDHIATIILHVLVSTLYFTLMNYQSYLMMVHCYLPLSVRQFSWAPNNNALVIVCPRIIFSWAHIIIPWLRIGHCVGT